MSTSDHIKAAVEDHHYSVGVFLKLAEAWITNLRYTTYLHDREAGGALDKICKTIQDARPVLDRRRTRALGGRPGGDAYFGKELHALHDTVYTLETSRKIHHEELQNARRLDRQCPLETRGERHYRRLELIRAERAPLSDCMKQELNQVLGTLGAVARKQPRVMTEPPPPILVEMAPAAKAAPDRHAALREALLTNPDQPQASFVERCSVHPNTVRRARRELEEAGAIPFLAHRHAKPPRNSVSALGVENRAPNATGRSDKGRELAE